MIFISAGHNSKSVTIKQDPGAVGCGFKEGDLTIDYRDRVIAQLKAMKVPFMQDSDEESLGMYLHRIQTGNGSVVIEFHFDAASPSATGTTGIVGDDADRLDKAFAKEITDATASVLGITNRGVITEADSHRGRLGLMRETGTVCLAELAFITNQGDVDKYLKYRDVLAARHAEIIVKYEKMI